MWGKRLRSANPMASASPQSFAFPEATQKFFVLSMNDWFQKMAGDAIEKDANQCIAMLSLFSRKDLGSEGFRLQQVGGLESSTIASGCTAAASPGM